MPSPTPRSLLPTPASDTRRARLPPSPNFHRRIRLTPTTSPAGPSRNPMSRLQLHADVPEFLATLGSPPHRLRGTYAGLPNTR